MTSKGETDLRKSRIFKFYASKLEISSAPKPFSGLEEGSDPR
jgi:hypothetical protein